MKKLILALLFLLIVVGSVSAEEIINETDSTIDVYNNEACEYIMDDNIELSVDDNSELDIDESFSIPNSISDENTKNSTEHPLSINQDSELLTLNNDNSDNGPLRLSNVLYVSPTGSGSGLSESDPASFSYANSNIDNNGIIYFLDGIYKINTFLSKNNLTLQAVNVGNVIIDADRRSYAFRTRGAGTKIIGLTLINGVNYGAIYSDSALTVINSKFINNTGTPRGGAIYSNSNITIINSTFINNTSPMGGAIYAFKDVNVSDSIFLNNTASTSSGGAIYSYANITLSSCEFKNNIAGNQGGCVFGGNVTSIDSNFTNNIADGSGGAIRTDNNVTIINSHFVNNTSINGGGGAIYARFDSEIINSDFINNSAKTFGGAVSSRNNNISQSTFINNNVSNMDGGAVNGDVNEVSSSIFINNSARMGGGIYSEKLSNINNCEFMDNNAARGGAIYSNQNLNVENSNFTQNIADIAGGVYANEETNITHSNFTQNIANNNGGALYCGNVNVDNSSFINNTAAEFGGAIFSYAANINNSEFLQNNIHYYGAAIYSQDLTVDNTNFTQNQADSAGGAVFCDKTNIMNSNFIDNNATNGGALIGENIAVINSNFTNNNAFDGAAIDSDNLTVDNCYFEGNIAKSYGIIYTVNATIKNSKFRDNLALGNIQVYSLNSLELINTQLPDDESSIANSTIDYIKNISEEYIIELESGLIGYCSQRTIYWANGDVYVLDNLDLLRNQKTGEYIGEYLKILLYHFFNNRTDLVSVVWEFTDSDFRNSNNTYVKEVLDLYDSGFRVTDKNAPLILDNNTQIIIDFYSAGKSSTQNIFLYNITYFGNNYNLTIDKISLNQTVNVNQNVEFDIIVENTGDTVLHNIRVVEDSYDDLVFSSWSSISGDWNYNGNNVFTINSLYPNESAIFRVIFNTVSTGLKTNVVVVSSNETNETNSSNKTTVHNPSMKIEKITITPIVKLGKIVRFEIIVYNTGDVILHNVSVIEYDFNGLIYRGYSNKIGTWNHEVLNNRHVFFLKNPLGVNESASFIISFLANKTGLFTNIVIGSSNETTPVTGKNVTNVTVDKINNKTENENRSHNKTNDPVFKEKMESLKTGNPIIMILIAFVLLLSAKFSRRKK